MAEEKRFENRIKKWLESQGIYRLGTPKQKMMVPQIGSYLKYWGGQFTINGVPDMLIDIGGTIMYLELKATKGRPSKVQEYIVNQINNYGGYAKIVYPQDWEDVRDDIKRVISKAIKKQEE